MQISGYQGYLVDPVLVSSWLIYLTCFRYTLDGNGKRKSKPLTFFRHQSQRERETNFCLSFCVMYYLHLCEMREAFFWLSLFLSRTRVLSSCELIKLQKSNEKTFCKLRSTLG